MVTYLLVSIMTKQQIRFEYDEYGTACIMDCTFRIHVSCIFACPGCRTLNFLDYRLSYCNSINRTVTYLLVSITTKPQTHFEYDEEKPYGTACIMDCTFHIHFS